jgi:guanylate kinase
MPGNKENGGRLVVIGGGSGAGKDELMKALVSRYNFSRIITCCAGRPIRTNEIDGVDYHFLSVEEFHEADKRGEFFEWQPYGETLKGTKKGELQRAINEILIWRIDSKSAARAKEILREKGLSEIAENTVTIYIGVPDIRTLYRRQFLRNPPPKKADVLKRMREDWDYWNNFGDRYDYMVINEDGEFERTVSQVADIILRKPKVSYF